jgi:uncharacterized protein (DUF302 family)
MSASLKRFLPALGLVLAIGASAPLMAQEAGSATLDNGLTKVRSVHSIDATVARLKRDIADKGITFFIEVDQSALAAAAGIKLRPSVLLIFGNPGLGSHFITSNPLAGIDWPVRLLVTQDEQGVVWAVYNDFDHIARRHGITNRDAEFRKASEVIGSITSSVTGHY